VKNLEDFKSFFSSEAEKASSRVLSLLDRDSFSRTYGCFDKSYWSFRDKDFPNSAAQMSAFYLCLLSDLNQQSSQSNHHHFAPLIVGAFQQTWRQQNQDGSFDEWYPGEHGWGGPTGYILYTQCKTYEWLLAKDLLTESDRSLALQHIAKACEFLAGQGGEVGHLTNHYAIVLAALSISNSFLNKDSIANYAKALEQKIFEFFDTEEGWSLEYDGLDVSYNMGTLSFLAKADEYRPVSTLYPLIEKTFKLLPYFVYPDGTFSGSVSSRHTEHFYPFAVIYWSHTMESARSFLNALLNSGLQLNVVVPQTQDDHYVHYLSWEFLQAAAFPLEFERKVSERLPFLKSDFKKTLTRAKVFIQKKEGKYLVVGLARGGGVRVFCTFEGQKVYDNCGYVIESRDRRLWTNLWQNNNVKVDWQADGIEIETQFVEIFQKQFTVVSSLFFRSFFLLARVSPRLAIWAKGKIKKHMIMREQPTSVGVLTRKISFEECKVFRLNDRVKVSSKESHNYLSVCSGGD
jgi:hypothetical protein